MRGRRAAAASLAARRRPFRSRALISLMISSGTWAGSSPLMTNLIDAGAQPHAAPLQLGAREQVGRKQRALEGAQHRLKQQLAPVTDEIEEGWQAPGNSSLRSRAGVAMTEPAHVSLFDEMDAAADALREDNPNLRAALGDELQLLFRSSSAALDSSRSGSRSMSPNASVHARRLLTGIIAVIDEDARVNPPGPNSNVHAVKSSTTPVIRP